MQERTIYIHNPQPNSYGFNVIIEHFKASFEKSGYKTEVISSFDKVRKDDIIIPYGLDNAIELKKRGYKTDTIFLIDAITLGYINKIKFYLRTFNFLHYDFFYTVYCLLRDYRIESKALKYFKNIILVSNTDIEYLQKRCSNDINFFCLKNGVAFEPLVSRKDSDTIRLGILSNWWHTTLAEENAWFIERYFKRYQKSHKNVKLVLAGRGKFIERFRDIPNVEIMGEVDSLNDFFRNIDIFISANPKGCGILNRVLDAFAHKTCVLGYYKSFTGFKYMQDSFLEFYDYESFCTKVDYLISNPEARRGFENRAFNNIEKFNDWNTVYDEYVKIEGPRLVKS